MIRILLLANLLWSLQKQEVNSYQGEYGRSQKVFESKQASVHFLSGPTISSQSYPTRFSSGTKNTAMGEKQFSDHAERSHLKVAAHSNLKISGGLDHHFQEALQKSKSASKAKEFLEK